MPEARHRQWLILILVVLLVSGVLLADVYLTPATVLPPAAYAIPILIAAYLLAPRLVAAVAVYSLVLHGLAFWLHPGEVWWTSSLYLVGTALIGFLSLALATRIRREDALKQRMQAQNEDLRARGEEIQAQNEELRVANEDLLLAQRALGEEAERAKASLARLDAALESKTAADRERERLLREVAAQRELFEAVVRNAPAGIAVLRGPSFVFELVNPAYQAIAPGKTFVGKTVAEVWPELAGAVLPLLEHVFQTGETYRAVDLPLPVQRTPGAPLEELYFTFSYIRMCGGEGKGDAILVVVIETTDHVHARRQVEELAAVAQRRARELDVIIESIVDGVFVCDAQGQLTLSNEAGARLLGLSSKEDVRRPLAEFPTLLQVRHEGRPAAPEALPLARALSGETVTQVEEVFHHLRTGRDIYVRTSAAPIKDERGAIVGAVAVARDVTALTELDRLKEQFIAVAAHELKTPVAIMKGYAQALLRRPVDGVAAERRILEAIDQGSDRIAAIVQDLLDISKLHAGRLELKMERLDLPALVAAVVERRALTAPKHRIRLLSSQPAAVLGDRDRLEQVLVNLLDNAVKYSPGGGDIEVQVSAPDHEAVVAVRDHGVGIPEDKQARIFQRFYSAHTDTPQDYGGMGVGLYISNEIVSRHGGRMWFESREGKGSTFYFSLPVAGAA